MWLFLNLGLLAVVVCPIVAQLSDNFVVVFFPYVDGSTGRHISSFVLVFLVLVGNLVIGLSPSSM